MHRTLYSYSRRFNQSIREGVLMRLESESGKVGWGEVAPLPGFSQETLDEAVKDLIEGNASTYPSVQWGQAAAMLDLLEPLDVDAIPIRILEKEKIKIGHLTLQEAIKKVENSDCCGVDMNQKWELEEAIALAKHFPHLDYFEEPLKPGENASAFPYPVALDESLRSGAAPPYPQIKMHSIKPMLHGYPLPKKVKGIDFILSSSYESELGIYQLAKLAYRLELPLKPMGLGTCHLFEDSLFEEEPYYKNGNLHFPKEWRVKMERLQVILDECI
ncbi:MAG: hypothetical protein QNJ27_04425 [Simkaniaceae bacterium]|nr:hypothetical protein [Simkaniaceae bacterium]